MAEGNEGTMPGRARHIPVYRERSALQSLIEKGWLPAGKLYPAGLSTIFGMLAKGWLQRKRDVTFGWAYRITTAGKAALKAPIPSKASKPARVARRPRVIGTLEPRSKEK
jgi:hypothetical protein